MPKIRRQNWRTLCARGLIECCLAELKQVAPWTCWDAALLALKITLNRFLSRACLGRTGTFGTWIILGRALRLILTANRNYVLVFIGLTFNRFGRRKIS
jgi:hypothetical protein